MRTQKCSKCGTMLDVTQLEKDSKFACSNCGNVLVVGETVAVKRSLKEGPRLGRLPEVEDTRLELVGYTLSDPLRVALEARDRMHLGLGNGVIGGVLNQDRDRPCLPETKHELASRLRPSEERIAPAVLGILGAEVRANVLHP